MLKLGCCFPQPY